MVSAYYLETVTRSNRAHGRLHSGETPWCNVTCVCEDCLDADAYYTWHGYPVPHDQKMFSESKKEAS